jgi:hypothetical protein
VIQWIELMIVAYLLPNDKVSYSLADRSDLTIAGRARSTRYGDEVVYRELAD